MALGDYETNATHDTACRRRIYTAMWYGEDQQLRRWLDQHSHDTRNVRADTPGQVDAVVTQFVTNTGSEAVSLYAFAQTPGFARQEGIISRLKPGQSIIRRFRFENVAAQGAIDQPLRVGLRETRGPAVLNEMLRLKPPVISDNARAAGVVLPP